jgi:hypothetical protein
MEAQSCKAIQRTSWSWDGDVWKCVELATVYTTVIVTDRRIVLYNNYYYYYYYLE